MEISRLIYQPRNGFELAFIALGDWFIQESLLHPVESAALYKAFADASSQEELETILEGRTVGTKTILDLLTPLLLTDVQMEEKVLNFPISRNSKINVFKFNRDSESMIKLNPDFTNYEITCTLLDGTDLFMSGVGGRVIMYGKSYISDYFTQIQNGIFYTEAPDSLCIVSVSLKEIKIKDMDLPDEVSAYKIRVRSYNE